METAEASEQIKQMCRFIEQEAKEKVEEINMKTQQDHDKEEQTLLIDGRIALTKEFEKKRQELGVRKRIIRAKAAAEQLASKMKSREELLDQLISKVTDKLVAIANDKSAYEAYIVKLIVQACIKLQETDVQIRCREEDKSVVELALGKAQDEFKTFMTENASTVPELNLSLSETFLPPAPPQVGLSCAGGIVALAKGGRIKCDNTFDRRMEQAFEALKPVVRHNLFPSQIATEIIHGSAMAAAH
mmetsp:Transcript_33867/g.49792  ORF Transcript_33867/g.49792 Transcript_33867/m.49792 type:complete len:245 (+) Transcript_33867:115-849(+)|eukprot:CAMPEP_0195517302 /NCGR_PEP_ID=MMETSP0794_2-20130614/10289_1 /TAXON_ID=515487 /ORGANISM="Stephanopyxis turris, Strain CCMP 815" /LENGTH=244 /DNA_ID=CAMNT_0040646077 /DNA_START=72 /DNA_END=806 /DNA_ORIENTATION=+